jgi:hypothetical protein
MKCIFAVAAVLLMAQADAYSQTVNRASSIGLVQNTGMCSGPEEQRFAYGTKKCFPGGTYYHTCTADGAWGLWKSTFENARGADQVVVGHAAAR